MITAINYIYVYLDLVSFERGQFAAANDVFYLSIGRELYTTKLDYKWPVNSYIHISIADSELSLTKFILLLRYNVRMEININAGYRLTKSRVRY